MSGNERSGKSAWEEGASSGKGASAAEQRPPQISMEGEGGALKNTALQALKQASLINEKYLVEGYDSLDGLLPGTSSVGHCCCMQCLTAPCCHCCCQYKFIQVDPGCVAVGQAGDGADLLWGPGVHVFCGLGYSVGRKYRVAESSSIIAGTRAIITIEQGFVGLAMQKGEPVLLPPGIHQWDDPDMSFQESIDLSKAIIKMGPYTLVTVEECYAAITQDNGKQKVLPGGSSYMLTHQNWKFQTWLSLKMQTNRLGPMAVTTGDNICLSVVANVNWVVTDAEVAAGKNVDASLGADSLKLMREDVNLQVTSSLASLVGMIQYGSQSTSGMHRAAKEGMTLPGQVDDGSAGAYPSPEPEPEEKLSRKALWDPERLQSAVKDANGICNRYGVEILSINLISAAPADKQLVEIMSRGAVATVSAEETTKAARAEANAALIVAQAEAAKAQAASEAKLISARADAEAITITVQGEAARAQAQADAMLVNAKAQAEAVTIAATAAAEAEKARAQGARDAGLMMGESEVAVSLAKLNICYSPFSENQSSAFFFGLQGPGELPTALLGNHLAAQTGTTGLALA